MNEREHVSFYRLGLNEENDHHVAVTLFYFSTKKQWNYETSQSSVI